MKYLLALVLSFKFLSVNAQEVFYAMTDFDLHANAVIRDDSTFMLTDNLLVQSGAMWFKHDIDLSKSFRIELDLFFGCSDGGADGITFILHPESAIRYTGEGMGVRGLSPSFSVEMDTYQNFHLKDAHFDHAALMANGFVHHGSGLTEPIPLLPKKKNVENCTFYPVIFNWDADFQLFTFSFNGLERIRRQIDLVDLIFEGSSTVYWGLSAATGQKRNKHLVRIRHLEFTPSESLNEADQAALLEGESYTLSEIKFETGSTELSETAKPILDKLMEFHRQHPRHTIILDSFTDSVGEESSNVKISTERAEAVVNYMISKGFPEGSIMYFGNGEAHPIDTNETAEGRQNNRRIEVRMKVIRA